jgi:hypothetical protein
MGRVARSAGWGGEEAHYRLQNPLKVGVDFAVANAKHPKAGANESRIANPVADGLVAFQVLGAIDFDD